MDLLEKFDTIDDIARGDVISEVIDIVAFNIKDYWVPTIPFNERNRAAVSAIVAKILIEHTTFYISGEQ